MAKKRKQTAEEGQRQSRKEILIARKLEQQTKQIYLVIIGVVVLLALVLIIGFVNEIVIKPGQPVAAVGSTEISLRDWQRRVKFQRAQWIMEIENLADIFGQDMAQVQQYAGQTMGLLQEPQTVGQIVLEQLIDDELIRQEAESRGISVGNIDVQKELEESFLYYDGESPPPVPTGTRTPRPTPSLTPFPTQVITEVVATNTPSPSATTGPTRTPNPTATPLALDTFLSNFAALIQRYEGFGSDEDTLREVVHAQLLRTSLIEELAQDQELATDAEHASYFFLRFNSEQEATDALNEIQETSYLDYWNLIENPTTSVDEGTATSGEILWRTRDDVTNLFGEGLATDVFELPIGEASGVIQRVAENEGETDSFHIIQVSGREIRPLSSSTIDNEKQQIIASWLDGQRQSEIVETFDRWRSNVPLRPALDIRYLLPPPTPLPLPTTEPTVETPSDSN